MNTLFVNLRSSNIHLRQVVFILLTFSSIIPICLETFLIRALHSSERYDAVWIGLWVWIETDRGVLSSGYSLQERRPVSVGITVNHLFDFQFALLRQSESLLQWMHSMRCH